MSRDDSGRALRVFKMSDVDWWIADSIESAIADAKRIYLCGDDEFEEARELTDTELDKLIYWDDVSSTDLMDFDHWQCECGAKADFNCRWNGDAYEHHHGYPIGHVLMENIHRRTFRKELEREIATGNTEPRLFATTEF